MSEQVTATQETGSESRESAGENMTSEVLQQPSKEQAIQTQLTQTEGDQTDPGKQNTILASGSGEESTGEKSEESVPESEQKQRAPEEYVDFTVPEDLKLEGEDLIDFKSFAKEQDLTQEQAQKVLDFAGPKIKAMIEQPYRAWNELQGKWQAEVK